MKPMKVRIHPPRTLQQKLTICTATTQMIHLSNDSENTRHTDSHSRIPPLLPQRRRYPWRKGAHAQCWTSGLSLRQLVLSGDHVSALRWKDHQAARSCQGPTTPLGSIILQQRSLQHPDSLFTRSPLFAWARKVAFPSTHRLCPRHCNIGFER